MSNTLYINILAFMYIVDGDGGVFSVKIVQCKKSVLLFFKAKLSFLNNHHQGDYFALVCL